MRRSPARQRAPSGRADQAERRIVAQPTARHNEKGTARGRPFDTNRRRLAPHPSPCAAIYSDVVHVELDRVGGHAEARDFLHLQLDVGVDVGVGEDAALGQEGAALVEVVERLVEAVADGRDLRVFFRRQVVQVLGGGLARVDLVLDAVQAGHQQRR